MARKKSADKETNFSVRVSDETLAGLQDLARLSRTTVSALVGKICVDLVKANKQRIANFRRQAASPIKLPTFANEPKENIDSAQVDSVGDTNAEKG